MSSAAIRVNGATKSFGEGQDRIAVLGSVSFAVDRGSWTTILGPSGCGKTTLLRILSGLLTLDEGEVSMGFPADRPAQAAYLPQRDTLLPWRTALGNAILASELEGRSSAEAEREALDLFDRFGLAGFGQMYPAQLSGGMRQRLALIRTFLSHREILLLDEPLGALDPLTRAKLQDWLLTVWTELRKTILLVTHDVEEALLLSDRILAFTDRPATIAQALRVELRRPRDRASVRLAEIKAGLLKVLLEGE